MAEPTEPTSVTIALTDASSDGVATIATAAFRLGVITCMSRLVMNIRNMRLPTVVPRKNGVRMHSVACAANPKTSATRFDSESATDPPWTPKNSGAKYELVLTSEIASCDAPVWLR
jgi:hypothetical protein